MTARADVAALRMMTETTGQLTQVQVQSISSWPKVAFPEVKSHETQIDPVAKTVVYDLKLKFLRKITDLQTLKIIEESVWALCGDTWRTTFKVGERILYAGSRRQEIRNAAGISFGKGREGFDPSRA